MKRRFPLLVALLSFACLFSCENPSSSGKKSYTVAVSVSDGRAGSVLKSPDRTKYAKGSSVQLTAVPASGYRFSGWSGDLSGSSSSASVVVDGNLEISARFEALPSSCRLSILVNDATRGSVSVSPSRAAYAPGERITATATPFSGSQFDAWFQDGATVSASAEYSFDISADTTLTANFGPIVAKRQVDFLVDPAGSGTVSAASGLYTQGAILAGVAAVPNGNAWAFASWDADGVAGAENPADFVVGGADMRITAHFSAVDQVDPTIVIDPEGAGSVAMDPPSGPYYPGDAIALTATAADGYAFSGWSGDLSGTDPAASWIIDATPAATASFRSTTARIRVAAADLSSGNNQSYDLGHGLRIMQGVAADVYLVQEMNYLSNTNANFNAMANKIVYGNDSGGSGGAQAYWYRGGGTLPNGIVSRYPILASGEWSDTSAANREFSWARVDIPGPVDLWAVSVHLLTSSAAVRKTEADQLLGYIQAQVPAGDYLVIGGVFNTTADTEACYASLNPRAAASEPFPVDENGTAFTNAGRTRRYDGISVDPVLQSRAIPTVLGGVSFPDGFVADTREASPSVLAALSPALESDSGATNMQHMAVVRDFSVPVE